MNCQYPSSLTSQYHANVFAVFFSHKPFINYHSISPVHGHKIIIFPETSPAHFSFSWADVPMRIDPGGTLFEQNTLPSSKIIPIPLSHVLPVKYLDAIPAKSCLPGSYMCQYTHGWEDLSSDSVISRTTTLRMSPSRTLITRKLSHCFSSLFSVARSGWAKRVLKGSSPPRNSSVCGPS